MHGSLMWFSITSSSWFPTRGLCQPIQYQMVGSFFLELASALALELELELWNTDCETWCSEIGSTDIYSKGTENQHHTWILETNYYLSVCDVHSQLASSTEQKNFFSQWFQWFIKNLEKPNILNFVIHFKINAIYLQIYPSKTSNALKPFRDMSRIQFISRSYKDIVNSECDFMPVRQTVSG